MKNNSQKALMTGIIFLLLAVIIGAFGAHGLKEIVKDQYLLTYKTGVSYQFYHGFALVFIGLMMKISQKISLKVPMILFSLGIILFSFNCYAYAITHIKTFAMIIPLGGLCFIAGWISTLIAVYKQER